MAIKVIGRLTFKVDQMEVEESKAVAVNSENSIEVGNGHSW